MNLGFENALHLTKTLVHVNDFLPTHSPTASKVSGFVSHLANVQTTPEDRIAKEIPEFRVALIPGPFLDKV